MDNLQIAQNAVLKRIDKIAESAGLGENEYEPLGRFKAKLTGDGISRLTSNRTGKLILVTAINPTPAGEGKTTVSIGLAEGMNRLGASCVPTLREPALGPVFGVKGGACGGGYSQVLPMEEINLFFNGDFPAITAAHNLLSAMIDNSLHNGNACGLETGRIAWLRATDMIDRSLRDIVIGLGEGNGPVRSEHFVITPASEVMAILCLANSLEDLQRRLDHIIVGMRSDGSPATAKDVGASNAMAVLLKDALRPNLVQTVEGGPALMHGGPFGNIAHGCSSMLSTRCALGLADYAVTEAGFGSDLGGEKFLNIVAPQLGKLPDAIVLVASLRALQHHGAGNLEIGWANLLRHYDHLKRYGPPVVVAINRFSEDTRRELGELHKLADSSGLNAVECNPWNGGGEGCLDLAIAVRSEAEKESAFETIYQWSDSIPTKLQKLVTKVYGGQGVEFSRTAQRHLTWIENHGYGELPICVAKTQYSLSDEPLKLGAPEGFDLHVRELKVSAGAGFIVAVCGDVLLMPGMGKDPAAAHIGIDSAGRITGMH